MAFSCKLVSGIGSFETPFRSNGGSEFSTGAKYSPVAPIAVQNKTIN